MNDGIVNSIQFQLYQFNRNTIGCVVLNLALPLALKIGMIRKENGNGIGTYL
jgi:hypothetical protein